MRIVGIICEYNPFHTGHEHHINKIRNEFGEDTAIIAIMSGNYTQRGEIAVIDKSTRAEAAVKCGINLVLELPFPFSSSSAEFFAKSGVKIANELKIIDTLSFGSESGQIDALIKISENMLSEDYKNEIQRLINSNSERNVGYPQLCEKAYVNIFGTLNRFFFSSNNILAIEYIKALKEQNSPITPHTVKREGADYTEEKITNKVYQSASAIRKTMFTDIYSALKYIPNNARNIISSAFKNKKAPCDAERLSSAILSYFRLNLPSAECDIHDAGGGLYNRLKNASFEATSISTLTELADTKKYTSARIRRAMWNSFFGVTSSEVQELPRYTQVLAMDSVGRKILKEIKKTSDFPVITKPSAFDFMPEAAKRQKELADKADSVFQITKPSPTSGSQAMITSPIIID